MDADDRLTLDILAALASLPYDKQAEGMRTAISRSLKHMSCARLTAAHLRIENELDTSLPAVRATLQIIEGQLALREIADGAFWR